MPDEPLDQPGSQLRLRLVQHASDLDAEQNLVLLDDVASRSGTPDLVVLPEAFARDFGEAGSDLSPFAERLDGPFVARLRKLSGSTSSAWLAGMFEESSDPSRPWNTLVLADQEDLVTYRKIHLYDSFGYQESKRVSPGAVEPVRTSVGGFPLGLMTCYDLRFPELARRLAELGAEALIVPAAWVAGDRKIEHWRTLLRARAIENTVWVVGVGQPGPRYSGHSMVVAPDGDIVAEADDHEAVIDVVIDRAAVCDVRRTNPSLVNRRL